MRTLIALALLSSSLCGKSAVAPPDTAVAACQPAPPPGDAKALSATRDLFIERAKVAGVPLPAPPALAPAPRWADLTAPQQADMEKSAGSAAAAPCYYGWMYGWYLVPRELARNLVDVANGQLKDRQAAEDDLTVAFLDSQQGGEERLGNLEKLLDGTRGEDQKRTLASLAKRHELKFDALVSQLKQK
jgi:hypothetical protein